MKKQLIGMIVLFLCLAWAPVQSMAAPGKTLKPFESDTEFLDMFAKWKQDAIK